MIAIEDWKEYSYIKPATINTSTEMQALEQVLREIEQFK
jgi:hypothetical protein